MSHFILTHYSCQFSIITRIQLERKGVKVQMEESGSNPQGLIFLNVGGKSFKLLRSTVERYPKSLLAKLVTDLPEMVKKNEELYVDRSPKYFEWILEIYRFLTLLSRSVQRNSVGVEITTIVFRKHHLKRYCRTSWTSISSHL